MDFPSLRDLADLASRIGISGSALLILALGIAWRVDKISSNIRNALDDFYGYRLRSRELTYRIEASSEIRRVEVEERLAKIRISLTREGL